MSLEQPRVVWSEKIPFGQRVCLSAIEKQAVGLHVAENFLEAQAVVFLSDGSSTYHMALRIFRDPLPLTLLTTNVAIALERALREARAGKVRVEMAGGIVDSELLMVCGDATEETIRGWAKRTSVFIASMRNYHRTCGPTERHPPSQREISLACESALKEGSRIIFVADHSKLSEQPDRSRDRPVFSSPNAWSTVAREADVWLVTNRPSSPELSATPSWICTVPKSEEDKCFVETGKRLRGLLEHRYIEIDYSEVDKISSKDGRDM
jgi:hypothetical protein